MGKETRLRTHVSEICWAPRVPKRKIRRLYESEATGLLDEELLDDVGISLYLRCRSILTVGDAQMGSVACPRCEKSQRRTLIARQAHRNDEVLRCPECSWRVTWGEYLKTYQGKQLSVGQIRKPLEAFLQAYEVARSPRDKILAIDRLIHEFHYNLVRGRSRPTRAACVNLIEGSLTDVVGFLNELTYGDDTTAELRENKTEWTQTLRVMSRWHPK